MTDVVPLPDFLLECACPRRQAGMHLTSCRPAREFDKRPLSERGDYPMGTRFQAIGWVYPLQFSVTLHVTVDVDPALYIAEHLLDYEAFELEHGYEEWEKPVVFITERIGEDVEPMGVLSNNRGVSQVSSYTERLHASLPTPVDPNQGTLDGTAS